MADFTADFQNLPFPFMGADDPFMELCQLNFQNNNLTAFSHESLLPQQLPRFPENFPAILNPNDLISQPSVSAPDEAFLGFKRRKLHDPCESSSGNSSTPVSEPANQSHWLNSLRKGKRGKGGGKLEDRHEDVVHVRARRGQATDSHSLAERVRRGKINDRLRCLQDIVPGCYKSMGMAVMLDEIINYVQSLQNQVEFLSMKLTAASNFYDFNSESDAVGEMQRAKAFGARGGGRERTKNSGEASPSIDPPWPF